MKKVIVFLIVLLILTIGFVFYYKYSVKSLVLSGQFQEYREGYNPLSLCFFVDEQDADKVQRTREDSRISWFCFSNQEEAKRLLKVDDSALGNKGCVLGKATVQVSNYKVYTGQGGGSDTATLDKVISSQEPQLTCEGVK